MVEDLDDLEVGVSGQGQDHVAGAESWVDAAIGELPPKQGPDARGSAAEAIRARGKERWSRRMPAFLSGGYGRATSGSGLLMSRFPQAGSAGVDRQRGPGAQVALACAASTSYAGWPISSISSARVGDEDRLGADMRLGVARAVPVQVVAAGSPAATVVLRDGDLGVRGAVGTLHGPEAAPDRQLPAHVRLGLQGVASLLQRERVQRAARAERGSRCGCGRCRPTVRRPRRCGSCGWPSSSFSIQSLRRTPTVAAGTATATRRAGRRTRATRRWSASSEKCAPRVQHPVSGDWR